jgi:hypothetical protein
MKGSPLLRVVFVVVALLVVLWPLRGLTIHRAESPSAPSQTATASESGVHLVLTSTTFPFTFEVSHLGQTIWKGEATESTVSHDLRMAFPREGVDLLVNAKWTGDKEAAVRVDVAPEGGDTITKILWGTGGVSGVLTFAKP